MAEHPFDLQSAAQQVGYYLPSCLVEIPGEPPDNSEGVQIGHPIGCRPDDERGSSDDPRIDPEALPSEMEGHRRFDVDEVDGDSPLHAPKNRLLFGMPCQVGRQQLREDPREGNLLSSVVDQCFHNALR